MSHKLSVVVPNYNHSHYIGAALANLCAQSRPPDEIIVIDDGSTDDSVPKIQALLASIDYARLITVPRNMGVNATLNHGLKEAKHPYVYFAAADDIAAPGFFEKGLDYLAQWPAAGLLSGVSAFLDSEGNFVKVERSALPGGVPCFVSPQEAARILLKHDSWISGGTAIYNTALLREIGGFHSGLHGMADSFAARVLALKTGTIFLPEVLAFWRKLPTGFASVTISDPQRADELERTLRELLSREFASLFPPTYEKALFRRVRYWRANPETDQRGVWRLFHKLARFARHRPLDAPASLKRVVEHALRRWFSNPPYRNIPRVKENIVSGGN